MSPVKARYAALLSLLLCLLLSAAVSAQSTSWYWTFQLLPYYTWEGGWFVCASGTLTSSSATANYDGSFLATGMSGTRTYYNTTGQWSSPIVGIASVSYSDNKFWPVNSSLPAVDAAGLSYAQSGQVYSYSGVSTSPTQHLWLSANTIVEGDLAFGDTAGYLSISQTQSGAGSCPAAPTWQMWSFIYTLTLADTSYVCASGQMQTWVGFSNGSYIVENIAGLRFQYSASGVLTTDGIIGVAQPYSPYASGINTNLIYPNSASKVDTGGLFYFLSSAATYGASAQTEGGSNVILATSSGYNEPYSPSAATSSSFSIVPWSATAPQCNSSSQLAAQPAAYSSTTVFNFIYTVSPYYNWYSIWNVCASGTMLVYSTPNADGSYNILQLSGARTTSINGATTTQSIVSLQYPGANAGNNNKVWLNAALSTYGLPITTGFSYYVNGSISFPWGGTSATGNLLLFVDSGNSIMYEAESDAYLSDTTSTLLVSTASLRSCSSLPEVSTLTSYQFMYTVPQAGSNGFAVCTVGSIQTGQTALDGGSQILNVAGTRTTYTVYGQVTNSISGVQQPYYNGYNNSNELYGGSTLAGDGVIINFGSTVQTALGFTTTDSVGFTLVNGQLAEYAPVGKTTTLGSIAAVSGSTWSITASSTAYTCPTTPLVTPATVATGTTTVYFSYTYAPYYTWNGEWSVCASGTITVSAQPNADYSYNVLTTTGIRVYYNQSGAYTQQITGVSSYDGADNKIWLTNSAYGHAQVDGGGWSYSVSGLGGNALYPTGPATSAVNFYSTESTFFSTPTLAYAEGDGPNGDVVTALVFSTSASAVLNCATQAAPTTQLWQFYYTALENVNKTWYVCTSGRLTTWVGNAAGGLLVIDATGIRTFYSNLPIFDYYDNSSWSGVPSQYVFSTGIDGMYGPLEWASSYGTPGNDNYIYPANSGTPSVVDSSGLLLIAAPQAPLSAGWGVPYYWLANFIDFQSNGQAVYEYLANSVSTGQGVTGVLQVWPYGSASALQCNTTNPPSPFPANIYWAFRYVVTPYYTWQGYWSVCASGVFTTTGWATIDYDFTEPFYGYTISVSGVGLGYPVLAATGNRVYTVSPAAGMTTNTTQPILGIVPPYGYYNGSAGNTNMMYPATQSLDSGGITYFLNSAPVGAGTVQPDGNYVSVFNSFIDQALQVQERNFADWSNSESSTSVNTQGNITFASVSSATSATPTAQSCSSLQRPVMQSYSFYYAMNSSSSSASSQWQVCASGQFFTNYVDTDGGQIAMEVRGQRYFNYPAATFSPTSSLLFTGMAAPFTYNGNDNKIYPNRPQQYLSSTGILVDTGSLVGQYVSGPNQMTQMSIADLPGTNYAYEVGGPTVTSLSFVSNTVVAPYSATGNNPTCKAPYTTASTQTLYFSYTIAFTGGSVCASGAITALSAANSDGSYTAVWVAGFRSYSYAGSWTNATIIGLGPQLNYVGDQKVYLSSSSAIVSSTGLYYATDNLIYLPGNSFNPGATVLLVYSGSSLTESGASTVTAGSGVVSTSASAVQQCGSQSVASYGGTQSLTVTVPPSVPSSSSSAAAASSSSAAAAVSSASAAAAVSSSANAAVSSSASTTLSTSTSTPLVSSSTPVVSTSSSLLSTGAVVTQSSAGSGGAVSNAGGSGGLSNGAIAGAVVGAVVGAILLCAIIALCCVFLGKRKADTSEGSKMTSQSHVPMEESGTREQENVEMSNVETGDA